MSAKKKLFLCILFLVAACYPLAVHADKIDSFWLSSDGQKGMDAIEWYKLGEVHYVFLPGNVQIDQMKIGFSGVKDISINNKITISGESAAHFTLGEQYTVRNGKNSYKVCIMQGSPEIPALYIITDSGTLDKIHASKEYKEKGSLLLVDANGSVCYDGALSHIKMRGNSSTTFKKKNYQLKLENGTNFFDMGKSRTWIITGNSRDKSLLRNQITLDLAMYAGMEFTPEHIPAEVYINNEYMGLFLFSEKVMVDDDRVDIGDLEEASEELNGNLESYERIGSGSPTPGKYKAYDIPEDPDDITGGYLVEFESYNKRYREEASVYYTTRENTLVVKSPEYCSVAQMEYISALMQSFENGIFSKDGIDHNTGKHYSEVIDMNSLVSKYMIEEISKNYDGNTSSMFFYKPADGISEIAYAGPVWDYDSAYGSYAQEHNKKVLSGKGFWINVKSTKKYWWPALYAHADFQLQVMQKYQQTFKPALEILLGMKADPSGKLHSLDTYAAQIKASADMNSLRWPSLKNPSTVANTGHTFEMNIDYLHVFLQERYEFLNEQWKLQ